MRYQKDMFGILAAGMCTVLLLSVLSITFVTIAKAEETDLMFPVNSSPYGISFQEWTQKWWQWYVKIPKLNNHNFENTPGYNAVDCSYKQEDINSPVFFVPYVLKEKGQPSAEATCNIPRNKAVMVGIDNGLMDYADPTVQPKTPEKATELVKKSNEHPNKFDIALDGKPIPLTNEQKDRVLSKLFTIDLPPNNIWYKEEKHADPSVADGWYLMLKPLSPGTHILHYTTGYGVANEKGGYIQEVTYKLVVR